MSVVQRRTNSRYARKRIRSATAPETSATVIAANMAWKAANARCGTLPAYVAFGAAPTPSKPHQESPPRYGEPAAPLGLVTVQWVLIGYSLAFAAGSPYLGGLSWW